MASGEAIRLGTEKTPHFYGKEFVPTIESVAGELNDLLESREPVVLTLSEVASLMKRPEKKALISQIVPLMVADGDLYEFPSKKAPRYLHLASFLAKFPAHALQEPSGESIDPQRLRAAYEEAVRDSGGFLDVEITTIAKLSEVSLRALKDYLLEEALAHRVFLSEGDWSMSPEWVREGVIWHKGKHFLKVRFP